MAEQRLWICDGCGKEDRVHPGCESRNYHHIKITAGAWGKDVDLCPKCHDRLMEQIDPAKWIRYAEAAPRAA
jgi:hypothetical protein